MVKLVDTQVLGTCALRRGGSSPSRRTIPKLVDEILYHCLQVGQKNLVEIYNRTTRPPERIRNDRKYFTNK